MRWQVRRAAGLVGVGCHYDGQVEMSPKTGVEGGGMAENIKEKVSSNDDALVISS